MPKNSELVDEIVKHALGTQTLRRNVWKYSHCYTTLQCTMLQIFQNVKLGQQSVEK